MERMARAFVRKEVPVFLKRAFETCVEVGSLVSSELLFVPSRGTTRAQCRDCSVVAVSREEGGHGAGSFPCALPVPRLVQIKSFAAGLVDTLRSMRSAILANEMGLADVRASLSSILSDVSGDLLELDEETLPPVRVSLDGGDVVLLRLVGDKLLVGEKGDAVSVCAQLSALRPLLLRLNEVLQRLYDKASVLIECAEDVGM